MEPVTTKSAEQAAPAGKPKRRIGLVIALALIVVLVAGGGGAAYWMWGRGSAVGESATGEDQTKQGAPPEQPGLVEIPSFLVNLADPGSQTFLRVSLNLLVASEEQATLLDSQPVAKSRIRSSILEVLAVQNASALVTPEGKAALKTAIAKKVASLKLNVEVHDVLFSDFVVQY